MHIKSILISYLFTFIVFLMIDLLWLGIIAKNLYQKYLGNLLSDKVNWTAAFIFYFIYVAGISIFAIYPAIQKGSAFNAILMGALFGLFTYATYDLTNLATLKDWPIAIVFIDILWGIILSASVSLLGFVCCKCIN
ncbi:DUF2177 family protein [Labilibaculum sp. DW002]|uniref:DUF2177 family protein n=1 Tax=Paralabilibaculum antarcticum TaxID=2912572 RepID=A0ABT5W0V0_9BACT|nr:DUF2177 family protein [Labilibaculum sp. DW002]MDE5420463.1 DUF2177 family protein [Labilibaculum sp. DW002]